MRLFNFYVGALLAICTQLCAVDPKSAAASHGLIDILACETISPDVSVVQGRVAAQQGCACGYHAAKNAFCATDALVNGATDLGNRLKDTSIITLWCGDPHEHEASLRHLVARREFKDRARKIVCVAGMQGVHDSEPFAVEYRSCLSNIIDACEIDAISVEQLRQLFDRVVARKVINNDVDGSKAAQFRASDVVKRFYHYTDQELVLLLSTMKDVAQQCMSTAVTDHMDADTIGILVSHLSKVYNLPQEQCFVEVAENIEQFDSPEYNALTLAHAVKRLEERCKQADQFVGCFLLGDMRQVSDKQHTYGHWITVVVHKAAGINGHRTYYVFDSLNNPNRLNDTVVRTFIKKVEAKMALPSTAVQIVSPAPREAQDKPQDATKKLIASKLQDNLLSATLVALMTYASWQWYKKKHAKEDAAHEIDNAHESTLHHTQALEAF